MPETITIEKTIYKFDELSPKAKERAVQDYCESGLTYEWWDDTYANAIADGIERGFDVEDITFSGFWSQGDGAAWAGSVRTGTFLDYHLKESDPDHARYIVLRELIRDGWIEPRLEVSRHGFHYSHSGTMRVNWDSGSTNNLWDALSSEYADENAQHFIGTEDSILKGASVRDLAIGINWEHLCVKLEEWITQEVRYYADDIYKNLQTEYEWLTDEENISDTADANDWRFDEDGDLI